MIETLCVPLLLSLLLLLLLPPPFAIGLAIAAARTSVRTRTRQSIPLKGSTAVKMGIDSDASWDSVEYLFGRWCYEGKVLFPESSRYYTVPFPWEKHIIAAVSNIAP